MTMRLPLSRRKKFATLTKAYANMTNPDEIKNKFHEDSNAIITTIPNADTLIILGGCDIAAWEGVIGKHANHDAEPATLGRLCSSHARQSASQETPVRRTSAWETLPWRPEKAPSASATTYGSK